MENERRGSEEEDATGKHGDTRTGVKRRVEGETKEVRGKQKEREEEKEKKNEQKRKKKKNETRKRKKKRKL